MQAIARPVALFTCFLIHGACTPTQELSSGEIVLCVSDSETVLEERVDDFGVSVSSVEGVVVESSPIIDGRYDFFDCVFDDTHPPPTQGIRLQVDSGATIDLGWRVTEVAAGEVSEVEVLPHLNAGDPVEVTLKMERSRLGDRSMALRSRDRLVVALQSLVEGRLQVGEIGFSVARAEDTGEHGVGDCGTQIETAVGVTADGNFSTVSPGEIARLEGGLSFAAVSAWRAESWRCTDLVEPLAWAAWDSQ